MRDEWFIRGDVPMTKAEIRAIAIAKLELDGASILLDIGAGTGSVSVEAALCSSVKRVYAFEKKPEAAALIEKNREKAGISAKKLILKEGEAPESFPMFEEMPTHAFIGGSSGNMAQILSRLLEINKEMRIVITVIALETIAELMGLLKNREIDAEIVSVQTAKARPAGNYHLMQGQNPVYIISFGGSYGA